MEITGRNAYLVMEAGMLFFWGVLFMLIAIQAGRRAVVFS